MGMTAAKTMVAALSAAVSLNDVFTGSKLQGQHRVAAGSKRARQLMSAREYSATSGKVYPRCSSREMSRNQKKLEREKQRITAV